MSFVIGQNDSLPRIIATLSADYDDNYPESDQIIYNTGDDIKMYIRGSGQWLVRDASVEEVVDGGRELRVIVSLLSDDVKNPGRYPLYFRNETIGLSFPSSGFEYVVVQVRGHE